jgi:hypothetical protein
MNTLILKATLLSISFFVYITFLTGQCVSGDCISGKGKLLLPSGGVYQGEFNRSNFQGFGTYIGPDGLRYSGYWSNRLPHGNGSLVMSDGRSFEGTWKKGIFYSLEDSFAKKPITAFPRTEIYTGCIQGDCSDGVGFLAFEDGSTYEGKFANSSYQGLGLIRAADQSIFVGVWQEGGLTHHLNLKKEGCATGNCKDGLGAYIFRSKEEFVGIYYGEFLNGLPNGNGSAIFANEDHYFGTWKDGLFQGDGNLIREDGEIIKGFWNNGEIRLNIKANKNDKASNITDDKIHSLAKRMNVWAVIIGISSYDHMETLQYADDDAYLFHSFLKSPEGGAIPDNRLALLIDESATRNNILNTLSDVFSEAKEDDLVIFYFSGHGLQENFLPIDYNGSENLISHDEINAILKSSNASFKICIADACHAGSAFRSKAPGSVLLELYYPQLAQRIGGTALLLSSKSNESSLESSGLRQGVFSHFLMRGLRGEADEDRDRVVTLLELFQYVHEKVKGYTGKRQTPVLRGDFKQDMPVAFLP